MAKKVSRRDFARTSAASAAAAVALPNVLLGETSSLETTPAKGAAVAKELVQRGRFAPPPPNFSYGGDPSGAGADFRESIVMAHVSAYQQSPAGAATPAPQAPAVVAAPVVVRGWREGTTIPPEYYIDEKQYIADEKFLARNLWFLADHEARIPKAGDYFVFPFGRGDSAIVLRDRSGNVRAFHNVCRHRGSRLCRHDDNPAPNDARLSVKQLGMTGNTPVFRCPYHAWTYDLEGKLIAAPNGMPPDFNMADWSLRPCHVRTTEGFIFLNFARGEAPDFDTAVRSFSAVAKEYGTKDLKIAARIAAPTKANWKLVLENFQECYHCGPAHRNLVTTHPGWDGVMPAEQRARLTEQLRPYVQALQQQNQQQGQVQQLQQQIQQLQQQLLQAQGQAAPAGMAQGGGMGTQQQGAGGFGGNILGVNMVSGTLDGSIAAPLLPTRKDWTHRSRAVSTGWSTGYLQCYDDHVAVARFTPRGVKSTDAELFWLVHPDAKEGADYQADKITALWDITYREDRWITENNHQGIESGFYAAGRYAAVEGGPSRFIKWYMTEVIAFADNNSEH
jgi:phenylpropionate dioxygenase-like ring-hydroxylating dioxygenase large terminal subunit